MKKDDTGTMAVRNLCGQWQELLAMGQIHQEIDYRLRKLINRTVPVADKMFLKTVKGAELVAFCSDKTSALREQIHCEGDMVYRLLSDLEDCHNELLKKTFEFRVKAG